jgi:hypothetical protein
MYPKYAGICAINASSAHVKPNKDEVGHPLILPKKI